MERIGSNQLYVGVIMFILGSAPLFELGLKAQQNAWLAMFVGALAGLVLTVMYLHLHHRAPEAGFTELYRLHFGLWLGSGIAFIHGMEQAYEAMRLVRDYGELTALTLLENTPIWLTNLVVCILAGYTVAKGVEVLFRVIELLFPIAFISYCVLAVMLYMNKLPDWHRLFPLVPLSTIVKAAIPDIMVFPYGQIVSFLAIWHCVKDKHKVTKISIVAYLSVMLMLVYGNLMIMAVLGPQLSAAATIPLLEVVQLIRLGGFLERLDIVATLLLFLGLYVKLSILFLAAVLLLQPLLHCSRAVCAWIVGTIMYFASFWERNQTVHTAIGLDFTLKMVLIFQLGIPVIMLVIGLRRKAKQKLKQQKEHIEPAH
ncbi:GerAB/ArcD/ProY family transporter [Paenibacillus sp. MMS18-CY102]|uniref:GerAB/ArcD/ProY family transporter n=1 Tax=Paenibacillus sp. MMS18-CY102 TaxID=2682849 RepID=UPI001365A745|nr:endospore germination permease [Paenibacillus sp. MMS18-CY102]MWC26687.1 endospore germination permease [Paenibacillus sp. MMS18-CY102]